MTNSILTKHQIKKYYKQGTKKNPVVTIDGNAYTRVSATVRYDDRCGNGHNSFSITGDAWGVGGEVGGCIHDIIAVAFPELVPFIKWHLTSSDGPMHYLANTMYHARTCTYEGKEVGEPTRYKQRLRFLDMPFSFTEQRAGFWDWMNKVKHDGLNVEIREIPHAEDPDLFSSRFSFEGFKATKVVNNDEWYSALFNSIREAEEWRLAMLEHDWEIIRVPTAWACAVVPDIEAARRSAIWPDATLEQLQDKSALKKRLPALLEEFRKDVESFGFIY